MKTAKIRFRFDDGAVFDVDEAQAADIVISQLKRYSVALAEATQARENALRDEHARLARIAATGRQAKQRNAKPRHDAIIADGERFARAFRSYERVDLGPLLVEFGIDEAERAAFGPRGVAAALGRKHHLTATQIRAILRHAKKQTKAR